MQYIETTATLRELIGDTCHELLEKNALGDEDRKCFMIAGPHFQVHFTKEERPYGFEFAIKLGGRLVTSLVRRDDPDATADKIRGVMIRPLCLVDRLPMYMQAWMLGDLLRALDTVSK